ncbi:MAG: hypothetical protein ACI8R4_001414 [Paracoccaceae bacterium]|jgi:hypothetical protein
MGHRAEQKQVLNRFATIDDGDLVFNFTNGEEIRVNGISDANAILTDIVLEGLSPLIRQHRM